MPESVTSCTLVGDTPAEFNMDRQRSYTLEYNIKTTGPMGPLSLFLGALMASPNALPDVWDPYACLGDSDADAFCSKISTKRKDPKLYGAVCSFATLPRGKDPSEADPNPLVRGVRYRGARLVKTRVATVDKDGVPITTSAKEEFDEPLEEDISYAVLVAERNIEDLDEWISDMSTYINSVNSTTYRTLTARKWWCMDIDISDLIFESGVAYYKETWQIAMNLDKWDELLLDRGWKVLESGDQVNAKDDNGKALTAPVLLDGSGAKLTTGSPPVALPFRVKREVDWTSIPV